MRVGDWMQTHSGRKFYPLDPRIEDIDFEDVAHHLSMICRYGGAARRFYSVAEHCVLMSRVASPEAALWALLHDAAEAYVGDMVRPLKQNLPAYVEVEDRILLLVAEKAGLDAGIPREVKDLDMRILLDERQAVMAPSECPWTVDSMEPLGVNIECLPPAYAEIHWLRRFNELTGIDLR